MGLKNYIAKQAIGILSKADKHETQALFRMLGLPYYNGNAPIIQATPFNGEKNAGELGAIKNYVPDIFSLAARSWQAYTESEVAQLIIHNYLLWTIGSGLKFKAEPEIEILSKIGVDSNEFIRLIESRFNLYLNSKRSTTSRNKSFHELAFEIKKHAIVGGDCLVILDYGRPSDRNKTVSARLIDSYFLRSPVSCITPGDGNYIINGIEINEYGEEIAYHILLDDMSTRRIDAYTGNGTRQAFLVHGLEYRIDTYRGMPLLSAVLESMKKLDRYKEATVGGAEERQKIPYSIEHSNFSTGEDPLAKLKAAAGQGLDPGTEKLTNTLMQQTASNIRYTTGKQVINMPIGATMKAPFDGKQELSFKEFYEVNFEIICATIGIPPEVAMNKYTSSFSSSRGANKNWEHKILYERGKICSEIYQPMYNFYLEMEIYNNRIDAPGYVVAKNTDDFMTIEAYQNARFIGAKMPFIDPVKEAQAVIMKLEAKLMTFEQACEELNTGDWETLIRQVKTETDLLDKLKLFIQVSQTKESETEK